MILLFNFFMMVFSIYLIDFNWYLRNHHFLNEEMIFSSLLFGWILFKFKCYFLLPDAITNIYMQKMFMLASVFFSSKPKNKMAFSSASIVLIVANLTYSNSSWFSASCTVKFATIRTYHKIRFKFFFSNF